MTLSDATDLEVERYRAFLENSTEGIWRCEIEKPMPIDLSEDEQVETCYREGYLAEANDAFARMYGFERGEELVGARLTDLLVREDPANEAYLRAFIRSGYRLSDGHSVETDRDGNLRHFSNTLSGVIENGFLLRVWGTQRDITAQQEAESRLRESEERFRALADNIAQFAWMADASGAIFWYNQRWYEYTGTTPDEKRVGGWQGVHHPDYVEAVRRKFREFIQAGEVWEDTFPLRGSDGQYRWFLSRAVPRRDERGQIVLWCGTNTDVTEQMEAEARQRRFVRELLFSLTEGRLRLCDKEADLPKSLPPASETVELSRPTLRVLRKYLNAVTESLRFAKERAEDIETAVGEGAMNAVIHGGGGEGWICADPERGIVQVWVKDTGTGISQEALPRVLEKGVSTIGTLGHGFSLILKTADRIWLLTGPEGTTVVFEQERNVSTPAWL